MKYLSGIYAMILTSILTGFSTAEAQNFIYAKGLKNSTLLGGNVVNNHIVTDHQGNVYVLGNFSGIADFDPDPDSANLRSAGMEDIFFAKYDKFSNYVYAKRIGGAESDAGRGIAVDSTGNIYITGDFRGLLDFDPGADTVYMTGDIFIAKYDPFGNYIYSKAIGNSSNSHVRSIALDEQQNFYITGSFRGPTDFDPGNGVAILAGSTLFQDIFFAKYDSSGNYVYAKALAGSTVHAGQGVDIAVSNLGSVSIAGGFTGTIDFDPGSGTANLTVSSSMDDIFLARYDSVGNYQYAKKFPGIGFDQAQDLIVDDRGNSYITGSFLSSIDFDPDNSGGNVTSSGSFDIFVAKHDSLGNLVYAKSIGGLADDGGQGITVDSLANVYMTGFFSGTVDFDAGMSSAILTSAGTSDIFILKLDTTGQYVYAKSMGGPASDIGNCIIVDVNGGVHATGSFSDTADFDPGVDTALLSINGSGTNGFVVSLANTGEYLLAIQQGNYPNIALYDQARQIAVDSTGNTYITGSFSGTLDFDPGNNTAYLMCAGATDVFVAKYDAAGNYVYAIAVGGTDSDWGQSIAVDPSGDVYISGSFRGSVDMDPGVGTATHTSVGHYGIFIARYDKQGNYIYSKSIVGSDDILTYGLEVDNLGNLFITGSFLATADFDPGVNVMNLTSAGGRDIFVARYDPSGNYVYAKAIGGPNTDLGRSIAIDGMGNVYITGSFEGTADFDPGVTSANLTSTGGSDIFLASYDALGNFLNAKNFGGTLDDYGTGIVVNSNGNLYLTGDFSGTVDFDAGPGSALITSEGSSDIFIAAYDKQGNYLLAKAIAGSNTSNSLDIATDNRNNVFIVGSFFGTSDFDPGNNTVNHTSAGAQDIFIAKYDGNFNYVFSKAMGGTAVDYGNSVASDRSGNIFVAGSFQNTAEFNRGSGSTNSVLTSDNADDIFFAKYGPTAPLPVQLLSFYVKTSLNNDAVEVSWRTASEDNNDYFEVERSEDGVRFEAVGRVESCSNCRGINEYAFSDRDPYVGISYYRLKQVDYDKAVSFSRIEKVYFEEKSKSKIKIYPAITYGDFTLVINNDHEARNVVVQVFNQAGSLIQKTTFWITKGNNAFEYNISALSRGIYLISLAETNSTTIFTSKIFKK